MVRISFIFIFSPIFVICDLSSSRFPRVTNRAIETERLGQTRADLRGSWAAAGAGGAGGVLALIIIPPLKPELWRCRISRES